MGDWGKLALVHAGIGYQACVLATIRSGGNSDVEGLLISAFVLYTITIGMIVAQENGMQNKILGIIVLIFLIIVAILVFAGMGVWGSGMGAYRGSVHATSGIFALLAGIFLLVGLAGGGGKTGPK